MMNDSNPRVFNKEDLTYNSYLKVPELLSLQSPQSQPPHHDELLFIIIHQAYELWFKLILHELETSITCMTQNQVLRAHHFMKRVVEVLKLGVQQIHVLETMTPVEFLEFRDRLMPASGFQSIQFREIEFLAGLKNEIYLSFFKNDPQALNKLKNRLSQKDLKTAYYELLSNLDYPMPPNASQTELNEETRSQILKTLTLIYQTPEKNLPLYLLSESLVDFDTTLCLWREHHVLVVERIIGFKRGTGGSSGVEYLKSTTQKKCFPLLWEVRTYLKKSSENKI